MNTVIPSGITPPYPVPEATPLSTVGPTDVKPSAPAAPQIEIATLDLIKQSAGATGKANPIDLVDHPQTALLRDLLARKDFNAIAQIVTNFGPGITKLELNLDEIKAIYNGFCEGALTFYSADKAKAIEKLLNLSQIDINQKIQGLTEMVDFAAVKSLLSISSDQALKGLNATTRSQIIDSLGLNSVMRLGTEATRGSGANYQLTPEEKLAAKLLKSIGNDTERLGILEKMSQFSRDDVTFAYINSLSADELATMPESSKKQLLEYLIDTSINLPFAKIDLNSAFNLDDALNVVSKNHAEAARRLYVAMKPETQSEQEVQDLRVKSDEFMKQINELEQLLKNDIQTGKIDQKKIDSYRNQLQGLQQKYPNQPELQKKVAELLESLNGLQNGLTQASQLQHQGVSSLSQTLEQLEQTKTSLSDSQTQLNRLSQTLNESSKELNTAETKLATQLQQLAAMRNQLVGLGDNFTGLLDQLSAMPESQLRNKLPQIELLLKQLQQNQSKLDGMGGEQTEIHQQLDAIRDELSKGKQALEASVSKVSLDYQKLQERKTLTQSLLHSYQEKLNQLESQYTTADQQLNALSSLPEADRQQYQQDLTQVRQKLDQHQSQVKEIQSGLSRLNSAMTSLESAFNGLKSQAEETQTTFTQLETQIVKLEEMSESASETREEINTALIQAKEQALQLINKFKSGAGSVQKMDSGKLLKAAKAELEQMKARLNKEAIQTPEQVQSELQEIDALLAQIALIQQDASSAFKALGSLSNEITSGKKALEEAAAKLGNCTQAVADAQAQTNKAQSQVQTVQQQLEQNKAQLIVYHQRVEALNTQLNELSKANQSSKSSYFDLFKQEDSEGLVGFDQMINAKEQEMLSTLTQSDQKRAQIESELRSLKATIDNIQSTMEKQDQSLAVYEKDLQEKLSNLQSLSSKVDEIKADYQQKITDFNTKQLQFSDAITALSQKEPQSNLVKKAITRAQKELQKVENVQKDASTLMTNYSQFAIDALASEQQLATGIQNIQTARQSTLSVLEQIKPIASEVNQEVAAMDQHIQAQNELEQRIKSIHEQLKSGQIDYASAEEQLKTLDFDSATAARAYSINRQEIDQIRDDIKKAKAEQQQAARTMSEFKGQGYSSKIQEAQAKIAEANSKYETYQSEFNKSRDIFLQMQKKLLEARGQIGISNRDYQTILSEMNKLLSSGKQIGPEDMAKLVEFEKRLQAIEQNEVQFHGETSFQIESLNHLKSDLNLTIGELKSVGEELTKTKTELTTYRAELQRLKQGLEATQPGLIQTRASLAEKIARLESKGNSLTADDRQLLTELKDLLKELDQTIATNSAQMGELGNNIQQIDEMLLTINRTLSEMSVLKLNLELLVGQISEAIDKYEVLLDALNALKDLVIDLKSKLQTVQKQAAGIEKKNQNTPQTTGNRPTNTVGSGTTPEALPPELAQKRGDLDRQSFSNRLTSQFSNMLSQRQRQSDKQLEEKHQAARESLKKNLEQQLQSLRQQESDLQAESKKQASLEAITEYLIQQAHLGNSVTSGLNIV